jgi:23S rRNA (cytidine1920-2'-O)/16S rRNA (cytidine1409-2'-O)-methyltransferase
VLDAGASTGGFTDCVLQAGALEVIAVDVGHGQLAWTLRNDPRVRVLERRNLRSVRADDLGGAVDLTVVDLSFISLRRVASALVECTRPGGEIVALVKPQFEAGRAEIGKGGIVRDPTVHRRVLVDVTSDLSAAGLTPLDVMPSPLRGAHGNVEFLWHGVHRPDLAVTAPDRVHIIDAAVRDAHEQPA